MTFQKIGNLFMEEKKFSFCESVLSENWSVITNNLNHTDFQEQVFNFLKKKTTPI